MVVRQVPHGRHRSGSRRDCARFRPARSSPCNGSRRRWPVAAVVLQALVLQGKDSELLRLAERENGEPRCQASVTH